MVDVCGEIMAFE